MPFEDLILRQFGIKTAPKESTLSVGTSPVRIVENNPNRLALTIVNLGANDLWVHRDRDVSTTKGVRLTPNGGTMTLVWDEDFQRLIYDYFGVTAVGTTAVYVMEVEEVPK